MKFNFVYERARALNVAAGERLSNMNPHSESLAKLLGPPPSLTTGGMSNIRFHLPERKNQYQRSAFQAGAKLSDLKLDTFDAEFQKIVYPSAIQDFVEVRLTKHLCAKPRVIRSMCSELVYTSHSSGGKPQATRFAVGQVIPSNESVTDEVIQRVVDEFWCAYEVTIDAALAAPPATAQLVFAFAGPEVSVTLDEVCKLWRIDVVVWGLFVTPEGAAKLPRATEND